MELDSRKIYAKGLQNKQDLKDGSVRYILYKPNNTDKQLAELRPSWGTNYELRINLPQQREVDKVIIITRTSANCFRIIISSSLNTELISVKTYDEINEVIQKSLNK